MKLLSILAAGAMARVSNTFFEMHADFAEGNLLKHAIKLILNKLSNLALMSRACVHSVNTKLNFRKCTKPLKNDEFEHKRSAKTSK